MIALGRHESLQQTLSQALNTTGLYNDYTFRSMLQAQEIRLCSPDRLSPRGGGGVVSRARRSRRAEGRAARGKGEKERLVTLDRFSWTSPECWRYQSHWRAFNNYIYLPYCSHDPHRLKREQEQICELDGL